jgi:hypothetical protein
MLTMILVTGLQCSHALGKLIFFMNLGRRRYCAFLFVLQFISWMTTCEPKASNEEVSTDLSESVFLVFRACMLRTGWFLEDLAMNSSDVRFFVQCCHESSSSNGHHSVSTEKKEIGPDGRDLLSMSASEIQVAFEIHSTMSLLIRKFIDRQLTSFLPERRCRSAINLIIACIKN